MVEFEKSSAVTFPVFTVCPAYPVAYNNTMLYNFGIAGRNKYRQGSWGHKHSVDEHDIFKIVTHDIEDIIKTVEMRFASREPNVAFNEETLKEPIAPLFRVFLMVVSYYSFLLYQLP